MNFSESTNYIILFFNGIETLLFRRDMKILIVYFTEQIF